MSNGRIFDLGRRRLAHEYREILTVVSAISDESRSGSWALS